MKLVTFEQTAGTSRLGALGPDGGIIDVAARTSDPAFVSMLALIEAGPQALAALRQVVAGAQESLDPQSVRWLAPLPLPVQMRDFLAFEEHARMAAWGGQRLRAHWGDVPAPNAPAPVPKIWYEQPLYYKCNRFAVSGPDTTIAWPEASRIIDYELEIACILGKSGRDISAAQAPSHIFGYTIFNDLTARDLQFREMQGPLGPAKGKDFDGANVLGPVIVTADELDPAAGLAMNAFIDGELWSAGSTATMHWSFADIIAHVSRGETLHAGEVLGSGTVGGGCGLEQGRFLKHGDEVVLVIEGIGLLASRIDAPHVPEGMRL